MHHLLNTFILLACFLPQALAQQNDSYVLGPGDQAAITVFGEADLSVSFTVTDEGVLNYPFLGSVRVAGITIGELEKKIINGLRGDYLINPEVTVAIKQYRPFYLHGEVKRPGAYPYQPGLTLQKALALGGGFSERAARRKVQVKRGSGQEGTIGLSDAVNAGDVITVPQSFSSDSGDVLIRMSMQPHSIDYQDDWEPDSGLDLRRIWNIVNRHKWAILALACVVSLLAALFVYAITPTYKATTLIHLQTEKANVVSVEQIYGLDADRWDYYETQAAVMKSRPIAARVLDAVGAPPKPEVTAEPEDSFLRSIFGPLVDFHWRDILPFKSPEPPGGPVAADPHEKEISSYLGSVEVKPVRDTQLIAISISSPDPRRAAAYANAHANAYIESILDARVSVTATASNWLGKRVEELGKTLSDSEARLQAFREQEKIIDAEGMKALPTLEINDLTSRIVDTRRRLSVAKIAYLQIYGSDSRNIESVPAVLEDSSVQQFRRTKAQAEQRVAELAKRYGAKHPTMIAARSELDKATENLNSQQQNVAGGIRAEYEAARSELAALQGDLSGAKRAYQAVSRNDSTLSQLQREVDTNRNLYEMFYGRIRETDQTDDIQSANARIIEPAVVPTAPVSPNPKRAIMLAFIASLMAGIGAAFLLEQLNNTIRASTDVEEKIGMPLLGMVPLLTGNAAKKAGLAFLDDKAKEFSEAVRTVRTGISLTGIDNPHQVILVTSSIAGEGKSTIASNLALAFAQSERVLLVSADMRRPGIGRNLNLDRGQLGLSELLAHKKGLNRAIQHLEEYNLYVINSGMIPPDPLELLSSRPYYRLLRAMRGNFARIIIDSPPVLPVSDAAVLSKHADAVVYVVKSDSTSVTQVKQGLSLLQRFDAPITGIVVNQLDLKKVERYSDYGYGGNYDYYGSEPEKKGKRRSKTDAASAG